MLVDMSLTYKLQTHMKVRPCMTVVNNSTEFNHLGTNVGGFESKGNDVNVSGLGHPCPHSGEGDDRHSGICQLIGQSVKADTTQDISVSVVLCTCSLHLYKIQSKSGTHLMYRRCAWSDLPI